MSTATAATPRRTAGGFFLLAGGVALAVLALVLFTVRSGGGEGDGTQPVASAGDANSQVAFWAAQVEQDPADFVALNRLAGAYTARARETGDVSDYSRAQEAVDRSLAESPGDNASAYSLLATLQNVRHEFAAARTSAEQAIALDSRDLGAVAALGDAQLALGQYDEALATYNGLVDAAPGLASFSRLAHIHEIRGERGEADAAWGNAFSTDGGRNGEATAWARVQYGNFKFAQGDLNGAGDQFGQALDLSPDYIHGIAAQAHLASAEDDYERSVGLYSDVVQRYPVPEYVAAYGDVLAVMGRSEEAERQYALVGAIAELYRANGIDTGLQMATYLADHDLDAESAYLQALAVYEKQPDSIYTADALAWTAFKSGRVEEAAVYSAKALRLGTPDATILYHAGMISNALGDEDAARSNLTQALEINEAFSLTQAPVARETLASLD